MFDPNQRWLYNDPGIDRPRSITTKQILTYYWPRWSAAMKKCGANPHRITPENCIDDWEFINYAWKDPDYRPSEKEPL